MKTVSRIAVVSLNQERRGKVSHYLRKNMSLGSLIGYWAFEYHELLHWVDEIHPVNWVDDHALAELAEVDWAVALSGRPHLPLGEMDKRTAALVAQYWPQLQQLSSPQWAVLRDRLDRFRARREREAEEKEEERV